MKSVKCIIVGSGLSGIALAWELYFRKVSFVIISNPTLSKSSLIAPGVWNPIVFKRLNPTWNASLLIKTLIPFYQKIENILQQPLITSLSIFHILNSEEEKFWKTKTEYYPNYLKEIVELDKKNYHHLKNSIKFGVVEQCGRLNTSEFIYHSLSFFQSINAFVEQKFFHDNLIIKSNSVEYDNILAEKIIFCEGHLISQNPLFKNIVLKPAKGEIVEIETETSILPENTVLHKGINIIPNGKNRYLLGSNYEWNHLNENTTEEIKDKFLSAFEEIFSCKYQVIGHYAGIRPAADRRPIVGQHPEYKLLLVLNGMGTKGVMLAPYSVQVLVDYILNNTPIDNEIDVRRFFK
ncbi:MAG TPA: FAD-dependent oxidoreductase [Bacteroidia bacterium]|nr:FAD-dependent oxidoreductase [Bacteroidia bacterium]